MKTISQGNRDTVVSSIVFGVALIVTVATVWVAIKEVKKRDLFSQSMPSSSVTIEEKGIKKIYSDDLINVESISNIKATKEKNGDLRLAAGDSAITLTPFPISPTQDPLSMVGKIDAKNVYFKTYNGILYTGIPTKIANEVMYYVYRGQWLFRYTCTNIPEVYLETILSSISYNNPGFFKSLDVDLGDDVAFEVLPQSDRLQTDYFTSSSIKDGILDTGMFVMKIPEGWDLYKTEECLVVFDKSMQGEQMSIFTIKSVTFTEKRLARFLDKVYGGYTKFSKEKIGNLDFITTNVQNKNQIDQLLVNPINRIFGLMIQSHSKTGKLTETQRGMIASIRYK